MFTIRRVQKSRFCPAFAHQSPQRFMGRKNQMQNASVWRAAFGLWSARALVGYTLQRSATARCVNQQSRTKSSHNHRQRAHNNEISAKKNTVVRQPFKSLSRAACCAFELSAQLRPRTQCSLYVSPSTNAATNIEIHPIKKYRCIMASNADV
jgi:hypothetical protein